MSQQPLFSAPVWTDPYRPGVRVRDKALGQLGTVTEVIPGKRLRVEWDTGWSATYGFDHLLEREAA